MNPSTTLLVVDDDPKCLKLAAEVLRHKGYAMVSAVSGEQALERARSQAFDLVLMDIRLPGLNGIQTLALLRAMPKHGGTPVVAVTASVPASNIEILEAGFCACLTKPYHLKLLVQTVADQLERSRAAS